MTVIPSKILNKNLLSNTYDVRDERNGNRLQQQ